MKTTRRPLGSEWISTGKGNAFASAAGAAEAATSAAKSGSIMRFPPRGAHRSRQPRQIKEGKPRRSALQLRPRGVSGPEREAVLPGGLRLVHGAVGAVEKLLGRVGSGFEPGHADGGADVESRVALAEGLGAREQAMRERLHRAALGVGEEHGELVAAQAGRDVAAADGVADGLRDLLQELIALDVPSL